MVDSIAQLVGQSHVMVELRDEIEALARSEAKVLITGESGTGKELIARALHYGGPRSGQAFVPVNCAGLPETLLESELFGHVKGSFTGAYRDKPGKLEVADGGTLFLDEVGEMTLRMQGLLLRFLENGELQKVGAERGNRRVNVRIIAATNKNLRDLVAEGLFREDLFYRLNVIHLMAPPLRDRKDDIPLLIDHFLRRCLDAAPGEPIPALSGEALTALRAYAWPGNVRELQNVVERLLVKGEGHEIGIEALPPVIRERRHAQTRPMRERRRTIADDLYQRVVKDGESFFSAVYPLYMQREISRSNVRELVRKGLEDARGNYKIVARIFNMPPQDYKKFLNFLRKHECHVPFKEYR